MTTTTTDDGLAARVEIEFPHEDVCHSGGCPGLGFCHEAGAQYVAFVRDEGGDPASAPRFGCSSRECDCFTGRVLAFVRRELRR